MRQRDVVQTQKVKRIVNKTYHSIQHISMHLAIHHTIPPIICSCLIQQMKISHIHPLYTVHTIFLSTRPCQKLVEDVIIPFPNGGVDQSDLFQQIGFNLGTTQFTLGGKLDINIFTKS